MARKRLPAGLTVHEEERSPLGYEDTNPMSHLAGNVCGAGACFRLSGDDDER